MGRAKKAKGRESDAAERLLGRRSGRNDPEIKKLKTFELMKQAPLKQDLPAAQPRKRRGKKLLPEPTQEESTTIDIAEPGPNDVPIELRTPERPEEDPNPALPDGTQSPTE